MPPAATTLVHPPPPHADDGGGALATTILVIVVVLGCLLWLARPWKRSKLPRARVIQPNRDSEEP